MDWKKASPELGALLDTAMTAFPCQKKIMFGAPVYTANGNMFAGIHGDSIFVRLSEPDRKEIAAKYKAVKPFELVKGHLMKEYVTLPESVYKEKKAFQEWLKRAHENALSLAPKEPKRRGSKKKERGSRIL